LLTGRGEPHPGLLYRFLCDSVIQAASSAKAGRRPLRIGEEIRLISNGAEGGKVPACSIRSLSSEISRNRRKMIYRGRFNIAIT
jgi:hypothetical protein